MLTYKGMNGGLLVNWFAHKHIGQLTECAAWPKHEQQLRKHSRRKILNRDGNCLQKLLISLLFLCFPCADCTPLLLPSFAFTHFFSSTFLSMSFYPPPLQQTSTFLPPNLSFPSLSPPHSALSSLPDLWLGAQ